MRENYDARRWLWGLGYATASLVPNEKRPQHAGFLRRGRSLAEIEEETSYSPHANVGILTGLSISGIPFGVIDFDDKQEGFAFVRRHAIATSIAETRRGIHVYVSGELPNRIHPGGRPVDLLGMGKYAVAPHSRVQDWVYRWIVPIRAHGDVAAYDPGWFPELAPPQRTEVERRAPADRGGDRRAGWVREVLFREYWCVEHAGGDRDLFRAACFLVQRCGYSDATALALLREWNWSNCVPLWPPEGGRIEYKIREARRLMK